MDFSGRYEHCSSRSALATVWMDRIDRGSNNSRIPLLCFVRLVRETLIQFLPDPILIPFHSPLLFKCCHRTCDPFGVTGTLCAGLLIYNSKNGSACTKEHQLSLKNCFIKSISLLSVLNQGSLRCKLKPHYSVFIQTYRQTDRVI